MNDDLIFSSSLKSLLASSRFQGSNSSLASKIGVSTSAISQYLAGTSLPRVDVLAKLAKELNVSTDQLIFGSERNVPLSREQSFFQARMDDFLSTQETNDARKTWLRFKIAERLDSFLDSTIDQIVAQPSFGEASTVPGLLSDIEVMEIEAASDTIVIASTTLRYNIVEQSPGNYKPGIFAETVVKNLLLGKRYTYLVPSTDELKFVSKKMLSIFNDLAGEDVSDRIEVLPTIHPMVGGFLLYRFSANELEEQSPYLFLKVKDSMQDSYLGLGANTSNELAGDMLMDKLHLKRAQHFFDLARFGDKAS